ncbi:MAG: hypothetical protein ACREHG_03455 [Candidatus Saccharimonadales bacterium]
MTDLELAIAGDGAASQRLFEALFVGTPKIDNRPRSAVNADLSVIEYQELVS